jgi:hypothetical protein
MSFRRGPALQAPSAAFGLRVPLPMAEETMVALRTFSTRRRGGPVGARTSRDTEVDADRVVVMQPWRVVRTGAPAAVRAELADLYLAEASTH